MIPYLQPSVQTMVVLKPWFQSHLLKVTKVFLLSFSPPNALSFVIDHTTKLGMKDLLKDQQWGVERDSNLIPPQYRPNALSTTPCSLDAYNFRIVLRILHGMICGGKKTEMIHSLANILKRSEDFSKVCSRK